MRQPVRIQRQRTKGWRMPKGAVYVGRPTRWGNPWRVDELRGEAGWLSIGDFTDCVITDRVGNPEHVAATNYRNELLAVGKYRRGNRVKITVEDVQRELRGKDLVCWCRLDQPCHADILLKIANDVRQEVDA